MTSKKVIAIDFGTTNTYVSIGNTQDRSAKLVQIHDKVKGIASALLYMNCGNSPYIGQMAIHGYVNSSEEDRVARDYRFFTHFKPDIETSETARKCSVDFLKSILRDAAQKNILLNARESQVIIGVPSESSENYQSCLKEIAREAGWGEVSLIHEPIGALFDILSNEMIPLSTLMAGLLVIDFGGGTCDFAYMKNGRIVHSWGEMFLGGRLFDDLFYQWFLEKNPGKEKELKNSGKVHVFRTKYCRELKEWFSECMRNGQMDGIDYYEIGSYGVVQGLCWEEFLNRCKNYKPSESFARQCSDAHIALPNNIRTNGVDLIEWFNRSLLEGLREKKISSNDIHAVVLAGGSSLWPFVKDCCVQKLNLAPEIISQSLNPYATISEGLAVYPAMQAEFIKKRQSIRDRRPEFFQTMIQNELADCLRQCSKEIQDGVTNGLFVEKIKPILVKYQKQGGTITEMKQEISVAAQNYQPILENDINNVFNENVYALYATALNKTRDWLTQEGLRLPESDNQIRYTSSGMQLNAIDPKIADSITNTINLLVGSIGAVIIASLCGGGGTALIMTGPIGWLIGLIIGGLATYYSLTKGKAAAKEYVESISLPSIVFSFVLTDDKITKCKQDFINDLADNLTRENQKVSEKIAQQLSAVIDKEIDCLSALNVRL